MKNSGCHYGETCERECEGSTRDTKGKAALAIIQARGNYFVRTYIRFALTPWKLLPSRGFFMCMKHGYGFIAMIKASTLGLRRDGIWIIGADAKTTYANERIAQNPWNISVGNDRACVIRLRISRRCRRSSTFVRCEDSRRYEAVSLQVAPKGRLGCLGRCPRNYA